MGKFCRSGESCRRPFPHFRALAGSPACLALLSPIPSSSSPWVLPGALLTAFWPHPPPSMADGGAGLFLAAIGLRFPHPEREAEEVRAAIEPPPHFEELLRPDS